MKHLFLLLLSRVLLKLTLQKSSIFGNFAAPKGLGMIKRLNDRSLKLKQNIYVYFYMISFDKNELYICRQFLAILLSPKAQAYKKDSMTEVLESYETFIFTSTQQSLININSTKVIIFFGNFAIPKGLSISKRINGRSLKIL